MTASLSLSVFLAKQFEYLLPHLERLVPEDKKHFLTQFFSQVSFIINNIIYTIIIVVIYRLSFLAMT